MGVQEKRHYTSRISLPHKLPQQRPDTSEVDKFRHDEEIVMIFYDQPQEYEALCILSEISVNIQIN